MYSNEFTASNSKITIKKNIENNNYIFFLFKYYSDGRVTRHGGYSSQLEVFDNDAQKYRIMLSFGQSLTDTTLSSNFVFYDGIENSRIAQVETNIKILQKDIRNMCLPTYVYGLKNSKIQIPYESICNDLETSRIKATYLNGLNKLGYHRYISNNDGEWFYLHDKKTDELICDKYVNFLFADTSSKPNPSTEKNLMILGDSFIQSGGIVDVIANFLNDNEYTNIKLVGTHTDTDTKSGNRYEGHGGYRAWDFINNPADLRPEFPDNPFWNPNTNKIDFKYYVETVLGKTTLDYAIIHLGINDKLTDNLYGENGNTEIVNRIVSLVNYIHASYPNCKVFINGLVIVSKYNKSKNFRLYKDDIFMYNSLLEEKLKTLNNTFFVPVCTTFDSDYAYEYVMEKAYDNSDETYKVVVEWLHPSWVGYKMIADQDIPCFIYNM